MNIEIIGQVTNIEGEVVEIKLNEHDITELIKLRADQAGIEGRKGRLWSQLDEQIKSVNVSDT